MHQSPLSDTPDRIAEYFDRLWPLMRSLTGDGVRATHDILGELLPLERMEIPSGTPVFDWVVPKEWRVREAYVVGPDGRRVVDVADHTLHLVNCSVPFRGRLSRAELDKHLHSLPEQPDAIPYVTSYYTPRWGFCLTHRQRQALPDGEYEVVVDTELFDGAMTLSEAVLPGDEPGEVLLSTYTCHPSMANNELSGPLVAAFLYRRLAAWPKRRLSYRFVFLPETIGSIAYLSRRGEHLARHLQAGYVLTCVGDPGAFTYKRSRREDSLADRAAEYVLKSSGRPHSVLPFTPDGSDERQYCSPGFDLPVGSLMRTVHAHYPQYHTSLDDRSFICFDALWQTVNAYEDVCRALEQNRTWRAEVMFGEPNLGKRGLYPTLGAQRDTRRAVAALQWVINQADGTRDLLSVAERSGLPLAELAAAAEACAEKGLLRPVPMAVKG